MPAKLLEDMTEPELALLMQNCAKAVDNVFRSSGFTTRPRFALVVFGDPAVAQYVASCRREDMIAAMRETAERLEKQQNLPRVNWE